MSLINPQPPLNEDIPPAGAEELGDKNAQWLSLARKAYDSSTAFVDRCLYLLIALSSAV